MMRYFIQKIMRHEVLTTEEAYQAMQAIFSGSASIAQVSAFLSALHMRGETKAELIGFIDYLLQYSEKSLVSDPYIIDLCGTGGDGTHTFNISTAAALLLAKADIKVAKHGGGAVSSLTGSADVARELGMMICHNQQQVQQCLSQNNFAFLLASSFNPLFKKISELRRELGVRTVFNLLGPLLNPLRIKRQVLGVYHQDLLQPTAEVLQHYGAEEVMVVHAEDGMDELSVTAETRIAHLRDKEIKFYQISPEELGFERHSLSELKGGDAKENAKIITAIFAGERGARRDVVILNAAAGFVVANKANSLQEGVALAEELI